MGFSLAGAVDQFASGIASQVNSYIYSGSSMATASRALPMQLANFDNYYQFLHSYHFLTGILDVFTASISEVIESSNLSITCSNEKVTNTQLDEINKFIVDINLKAQIIEDLDDHVFKGGYYYNLDIDNRKLYSVLDYNKFQVVKQGTNVVGYIYSNKYHKLGDAVAYWYRKDESIGVPKSKLTKSKTYKGILTKEVAERESYEILITKSTVKGIFKDQLQRLYQCYVMEYIQFFLGLRESVKPYILSMNYTGNRTDISQAAQASDRIESLLNQPSSFMNSVMDPLAFMNTITYTLFNNIKVVPNVDHFNNLSELQSGDFTNIRDKASRELDESKKQVLNNLGVPEELMGGNSNKWETASRNDRFATILNNHLTREANFIKMVALAYIQHKGWNIKYDELKLNLSASSFMATYQQRTKLSVLTDRLSEVQKLIETSQNLINNKVIDEEKLKKFMIDQIGSMDAGIGSILNFKNLKAESNEPKDVVDDPNAFRRNDGW